MTARHIVQKLPAESVVSRWGDEILLDFHEVPADTGGVTRQVDIGDVAFWPEGKRLCVFFGRTPASVVEKPVAESPVVVIGRTFAHPEELKGIQAGEKISIKLAESGAAIQNTDSDFSDRKLSQDEIDVLVKQLLAEKAKQ